MDSDETQASEFDAESAAKDLGLSDMQLKFALAYHRIGNATLAAKAAGYSESGKDSYIRSSASKTLNSPKVQRFLDLAAMADKGLHEKPATAAERKRRLSKIVRGGSASDVIRANDSLQRMEENEAKSNPDDVSGSMEDTIAEIYAVCPELAIHLSALHSIPIQENSADQLSKIATAHYQIAASWIAANPEEATRLLRISQAQRAAVPFTQHGANHA